VPRATLLTSSQRLPVPYSKSHGVLSLTLPKLTGVTCSFLNIPPENAASLQELLRLKPAVNNSNLFFDNLNLSLPIGSILGLEFLGDTFNAMNPLTSSKKESSAS
jgi:hypothetical protein